MTREVEHRSEKCSRFKSGIQHEYDKALEYLDLVIEMREKWIDEDFPPMFGSLYDQANDF